MGLLLWRLRGDRIMTDYVLIGNKILKKNKVIPKWRKIRKFITKHLFGYVNVKDFGVSEENEDNTIELQNAIDYCSKLHTKETINLGRSGGHIQGKGAEYNARRLK